MSATLVTTINGASYTGPPIPCQIGHEQVFVMLSRDPQGNGPICFAHVLAGDGRHLIDSPIDLRAFPCHDTAGNPFALNDCFGASVFVSQADPAQSGGTIKFAVNAKTDDGNGRGLVIVSTGKKPVVTT